TRARKPALQTMLLNSIPDGARINRTDAGRRTGADARSPHAAPPASRAAPTTTRINRLGVTVNSYPRDRAECINRSGVIREHSRRRVRSRHTARCGYAAPIVFVVGLHDVDDREARVDIEAGGREERGPEVTGEE